MEKKKFLHEFTPFPFVKFLQLLKMKGLNSFNNTCVQVIMLNCIFDTEKSNVATDLSLFNSFVA